MKSSQSLIIHLLNSLVFICVFLSLTIPALATNNQKQLDNLRNHIQKLKSELIEHEKTQQDATNILQETELSISHIHRTLTKLKEDKQKIDHELKQISIKQKQLKQSLEEKSEQLNQLLFQQFLRNEQNYLRILLNQDNLNQIARNIYYFQQLSQQNTDTIDMLHDTLNQLQSLTNTTQRKKIEIATITADYVKQKQKLEQEKSRHEIILTHISQKIAQQRNAVSKLILDENRISKLVTGIQDIFQQENEDEVHFNTRLPDSTNRHHAFHTLKGKLNFPVRGKLVNRYGEQRSGNRVTWKGLFIQSPVGSEIKAIATGRVVFADWLRGFGNLMIIDHSQDYMSLYGNTEALLKQVGDNVYSGDTIAIVGKSGGNPDSGLYFELRYKGKAFDPLTWVEIE